MNFYDFAQGAAVVALSFFGGAALALLIVDDFSNLRVAGRAVLKAFKRRPRRTPDGTGNLMTFDVDVEFHGDEGELSKRVGVVTAAFELVEKNRKGYDDAGHGEEFDHFVSWSRALVQEFVSDGSGSFTVQFCGPREVLERFLMIGKNIVANIVANFGRFGSAEGAAVDVAKAACKVIASVENMLNSGKAVGEASSESILQEIHDVVRKYHAAEPKAEAKEPKAEPKAEADVKSAETSIDEAAEASDNDDDDESDKADEADGADETASEGTKDVLVGASIDGLYKMMFDPETGEYYLDVDAGVDAVEDN